MRIGRFLKQFNWRFLLVRILVSALAPGYHRGRHAQKNAAGQVVVELVAY